MSSREGLTYSPLVGDSLNRAVMWGRYAVRQEVEPAISIRLGCLPEKIQAGHAMVGVEFRPFPARQIRTSVRRQWVAKYTADRESAKI